MIISKKIIKYNDGGNNILKKTNVEMRVWTSLHSSSTEVLVNKVFLKVILYIVSTFLKQNHYFLSKICSLLFWLLDMNVYPIQLLQKLSIVSLILWLLCRNVHTELVYIIVEQNKAENISK